MTHRCREGAGSRDHPPTHPGVPPGLNFPTSWDWTCDGTACLCGDTERPSDSPVFPQLLNYKAGVCILGPFDPRFTFSLRHSVSLRSSPQVPCLPLWPTAFWGIVIRITPWTGLDGRILHGRSLHRQHPPGKYLNSGLDPEKCKRHATRREEKHCRGQEEGLWRERNRTFNYMGTRTSQLCDLGQVT